MENPRPEEEKIMKDINPFRLKKERNCTAIKDLRNLFRLGKETKANKDRNLEILKIFLRMKTTFEL